MFKCVLCGGEHHHYWCKDNPVNKQPVTFVFRCPDYWKPKYATDLFNRKLVSIRLASPKARPMLPNISGRE